MSHLDKAIIDATSCESYHQCCCHSNLAIAIMVLLPTKANINVIPAEASINAAVHQRYHWCRCPQKLSRMSSLNKAIIDAASCASYHQCCYHSKLAIAIMVLFPTEAKWDTDIIQNKHCCLPKISWILLPAEAIMDIATRQSYYRWCILQKLSSISSVGGVDFESEKQSWTAISECE